MRRLQLADNPVVQAVVRMVHEALRAAKCKNLSRHTYRGTCRHHREYVVSSVHITASFSLAFYDECVEFYWPEGGTRIFEYSDPEFIEKLVALVEAGRHCYRVREGM